MSTQTCLTCPSIVTDKAAADHFGVPASDLGTGIFCSRYGYVLGNSQGVREGLAESYGSNCPSHGRPVPANKPDTLLSGMFMPRPDLLTPTDPSNRPLACIHCEKFDDAKSACAATGMVVFKSKAADVAQKCNFGIYGAPKCSVDEHLPGWDTKSVPVQVTLTGGNMTNNPTSQPAPPAPKVPKAPVILEPVDYNSDAKVTPDHVSKGIKAWRRVTSPKGRDHYLPIFRTDFFTEEQQSRIPKTGADYGDPSLFIDHDNVLVEFAVQSYAKDLNLVLIGEPGSGKTEAARFLAWQLNLPFDRITYNEDTDPDEVLGFHHYGEHEVPDGSGGTKTVTGTYFRPGELPLIWQTMGVRLSDEPNIAKEAIVQAYRSMNDSSRELVVAGERFVRHDYCFHIMAMNPHYDFRNIGAKPMASADSRRLSFHFMTPPNEAQIKEIIQRAVLTLDGDPVPEAVMKVIVNAGKDLRQMTKDNLIPDFWTTSQEVKVARLIPDFGVLGAYRRAYFNYIDPEVAQIAMQAIESHIPAGSDFR